MHNELDLKRILKKVRNNEKQSYCAKNKKCGDIV